MSQIANRDNARHDGKSNDREPSAFEFGSSQQTTDQTTVGYSEDLHTRIDGVRLFRGET